MIFIVSYDLNRPGQDYPNLYETIKTLGSWAHPLESTWLVDTTMTAKMIFDTLWAQMDRNDKLLVARMQEHWWGSFDQRVLDWLSGRAF